MQTAFTNTFYGGARERDASRGALAYRLSERERGGHEPARGSREAGASLLARGLGLFSVALGVAHLLAPRSVAQRIGLRENRGRRSAVLAVGMRDLVVGLGILTSPRPAGWLWARVAGDVMDLALLGGSLEPRRANRPKVLQGMASVAGILVLDVLTAAQSSRVRGAGFDRAARRGGIRVAKAFTVNRPVEDVYRFWHDFQNLPRFMDHLESVSVRDGSGQSHWRAKGPLGTALEWDAEVTEDRPNALIAWRSLRGADIDNAGTVSFAPAEGGRGTVVRVDIRYAPPGRTAGATLAKLFGKVPQEQLGNDLRRFKQVMETGEVLHSDASIHRGPHAARPPRRDELEALR